MHSLAHFFATLFTLRRFTSVGWMAMRILTIGTFLAISYRLFPRRTR